jgi:hypothetical protein
MITVRPLLSRSFLTAWSKICRPTWWSSADSGSSCKQVSAACKCIFYMKNWCVSVHASTRKCIPWERRRHRCKGLEPRWLSVSVHRSDWYPVRRSWSDLDREARLDPVEERTRAVYCDTFAVDKQNRRECCLWASRSEATAVAPHKRSSIPW